MHRRNSGSGPSQGGQTRLISFGSLAIIPASIVTSFLLRRWGYRQPIILGLLVVSAATLLLGQDPETWKILGLPFGVVGNMAFIVMLSGLGFGMSSPAAYNACIELMPEKVGTISGLRGMCLYVGGALGISLITVVLHLSSTQASGFRIAFVSSGLVLLFTIPLVFLMPTGKKKRGPS